MASVYEFDNYRKFLAKKIGEMPNKGYGQLSQLARQISVHTSLISQILKGHKELTTDQAALVTEYFQMNESETEYFVQLVHLQRAGNQASRKIYSMRLQKLKEKTEKISNRVKVTAKLSAEVRAVFYSDWTYTAVRQTVAILHNPDAHSIGSYLGLPPKKVQPILDFLIQAGLCKIISSKLTTGTASTHLDSDSPWIKVHHINWRQKSIQNMELQNDSDIHYTAPMTLSKKDVALVREKLIQYIEEINSIVDPSPSEELCCLNIDWFKIKKSLT